MRTDPLTKEELLAGEQTCADWAVSDENRFPHVGLRELITEHSIVVEALAETMDDIYGDVEGLADALIEDEFTLTQLLVDIYMAGIIVGMGIAANLPNPPAALERNAI